MQVCGKQVKDIQRFADWGFDYYKFNWATYTRVNRQKGLCRAERNLPTPHGRAGQRPSRLGVQRLRPNLFREMGDDIGGNCWLATPDITDTWPGISTNGFSQTGHEQSAKPGHWNNADMLVSGNRGLGHSPTHQALAQRTIHPGQPVVPFQFAPCARLRFAQLDEFTLNLLTNDEVLDVDQDPLGKQARRVPRPTTSKSGQRTWKTAPGRGTVQPRGSREQGRPPTWSDLNLSGKQIVRDLWRQKDQGEFENQFSATVPRHGVVLVRIRASGK